MSFCPKCRYEYVPGIKECPDCAIKLVEKLHEKEREEPEPDVKIVTIATYRLPVQAEEAKLTLESFGIPCMVVGDIAARTTSLYATWVGGGVQLQVREDDAERATVILSEKIE